MPFHQKFQQYLSATCILKNLNISQVSLLGGCTVHVRHHKYFRQFDGQTCMAQLLQIWPSCRKRIYKKKDNTTLTFIITLIEVEYTISYLYEWMYNVGTQASFYMISSKCIRGAPVLSPVCSVTYYSISCKKPSSRCISLWGGDLTIWVVISVYAIKMRVNHWLVYRYVKLHR